MKLHALPNEVLQELLGLEEQKKKVEEAEKEEMRQAELKKKRLEE